LVVGDIFEGLSMQAIAQDLWLFDVVDGILSWTPANMTKQCGGNLLTASSL
jgi:hypothetical protein